MISLKNWNLLSIKYILSATCICDIANDYSLSDIRRLVFIPLIPFLWELWFVCYRKKLFMSGQNYYNKDFKVANKFIMSKHQVLDWKDEIYLLKEKEKSKVFFKTFEMLTKNFLIQFQWTISLLLQLFLFGCFCCSCKIHCNFTFAWKIIGLAIAIPLFLLSTSLFRDLFKNLCLWLWRSCRFIR